MTAPRIFIRVSYDADCNSSSNLAWMFYWLTETLKAYSDLLVSFVAFVLLSCNAGDYFYESQPLIYLISGWSFGFFLDTVLDLFDSKSFSWITLKFFVATSCKTLSAYSSLEHSERSSEPKVLLLFIPTVKSRSSKVCEDFYLSWVIKI